MRKRDKIVIWPIYFNSKVTRKQGRRVPLELAVEDPKAEEIYQVAEKIGLNPILEEDKAYPKMWWKERGRILVDKTKSKTTILKEIAIQLKEFRLKQKMKSKRIIKKK
ncbi:MAG: signal recognition particle protein Srp19 [archaeon GB-1867-035]|nr:signal recognition particle protein Srp19 [Candidatus Culexmicrobium profundum]